MPFPPYVYGLISPLSHRDGEESRELDTGARVHSMNTSGQRAGIRVNTTLSSAPSSQPIFVGSKRGVVTKLSEAMSELIEEDNVWPHVARSTLRTFIFPTLSTLGNFLPVVVSTW